MSRPNKRKYQHWWRTRLQTAKVVDLMSVSFSVLWEGCGAFPGVFRIHRVQLCGYRTSIETPSISERETSFRNKASSVCFANSADKLPPSEMCSAKSTVLVLLTWCVSKFVHLLIQTNKQVQWKIGVCHTLARRRKEFTTPVSAGSTNCVRCSEVDCWNRIVEILLFWFLIQARKLWMKQEPKRLDMNVCACVSTMVCVCRCTCVLLSFMGNNFYVINFL